MSSCVGELLPFLITTHVIQRYKMNAYMLKVDHSDLDVFTSLHKGYMVNVLKFGTSNNKMAYANSVDPDQTALSGAVWSGSTLFAIPLNILRNNCIKSSI